MESVNRKSEFSELVKVWEVRTEADAHVIYIQSSANSAYVTSGSRKGIILTRTAYRIHPLLLRRQHVPNGGNLPSVVFKNNHECAPHFTHSTVRSLDRVATIRNGGIGLKHPYRFHS